MNKAGQTAVDIADFWNQTAIAHLLTRHIKGQTDDDQDKTTTNYFGHNPLDRSANKRTDKAWLAAITKDQKTKFLLFSRSSPYVQYSEDGTCHICLFSYQQVAAFIENPRNQPNLVLLGLGHLKIGETSTKSDEEQEQSSAWFALDVSDLASEEEVQKINQDAQLMSLKNPLALMSLEDQEAGVLAQAR